MLQPTSICILSCLLFADSYFRHGLLLAHADYKTYFEGTVDYAGQNTLPGMTNFTKAKLTWSFGTYYFANTVGGQYTVAQLNRYVRG